MKCFSLANKSAWKQFCNLFFQFIFLDLLPKGKLVTELYSRGGRPLTVQRSDSHRWCKVNISFAFHPEGFVHKAINLFDGLLNCNSSFMSVSNANTFNCCCWYCHHSQTRNTHLISRPGVLESNLRGKKQVQIGLLNPFLLLCISTILYCSQTLEIS